LCQFLIDSGANVNAVGGEAEATPVIWAAQKCAYYVVHLLLKHGADPLLTDKQGFNLLHSVVLDGNAFQLTLLLHQDISIDVVDNEGHTSLMWAAYKGHYQCVDLLLRWGADVYARDQTGFTALHWALVSRVGESISKLVEYGADRFAESNEGKTPAVVAREMKIEHIWIRALDNWGFDASGVSRPSPIPFFNLTASRRRAFLLLWPSFILLCLFVIFSQMPIYFALPAAFFTGYCLVWVVNQALQLGPGGRQRLSQSPVLAGIFIGSIGWLGIRYLTRIMPWTLYDHPFLNILFAALFAACSYFYYYCMAKDAGFVPKPASRNQQREVMSDLLDNFKFDQRHFCVDCMTRRPLRSKHCRICKRCVAKHDQYVGVVLVMNMYM